MMWLNGRRKRFFPLFSCSQIIPTYEGKVKSEIFFNNNRTRIIFICLSPPFCWTFLMLFFISLFFISLFFLLFARFYCHSATSDLTYFHFIYLTRLPSLIHFSPSTDRVYIFCFTTDDPILMIGVCRYFRLSCCFCRSRSRHAEPEKPKKKKTLTTATNSLVSIPNTIKLSMLNSGLLNYDKIRLSVKGE